MTRSLVLVVVAGAAGAVLGATGCNLLLDFDSPRRNAEVGTVGSGSWIQSEHVGIAIASEVNYLPDPEFDVVLSGSDPYQVIAVPIAPVGRSGPDGVLTDAERVDTDGTLSLDIPTDLETDNAFGAALSYRDGLLLVGTPGVDASRQGLVRTYSPDYTSLDLPFGADLVDPDAMDRRGSFGISVAVADVDGSGVVDAIVGDLGMAWWFPGPASLPDNSFDPSAVVQIGAVGGSWGSVVAGSDGSFNVASTADDIAVADPNMGTVDTFFWDAGTMALVPGVSFTGLPGAVALAFMDGGTVPLLAVGSVDSGSGGAVFLCDEGGSCEELMPPDADGVSWRDLGRSLATGDLNNDGVDDLIAGAPESAVDAVPGAGAAAVWFGDGTGGVRLADGEVLTLRRAAGEENDHFGAAVAVLGTNLDEDLCGEVAVGAPQAGGLFTKGLVLVFFELVAGGGALPGASNVDCN